VTIGTAAGRRQRTSADEISPDPLLTPYNPQDLNPYAYATDSPVTDSDPTGLTPDISGGECTGSIQYCENHATTGNNTSGQNNGRTDPYTPYTSPASGTDLTLFLSPPPIVARTPRITAPHQASTGSYNDATCGRFALDCSGFSQAAAGIHREDTATNPFTIIWHGLVDAGRFIKNNRGTLATIGALLTCASEQLLSGAVARLQGLHSS
jgi:hypothetical protein